MGSCPEQHCDSVPAARDGQVHDTIPPQLRARAVDRVTGGRSPTLRPPLQQLRPLLVSRGFGLGLLHTGGTVGSAPAPSATQPQAAATPLVRSRARNGARPRPRLPADQSPARPAARRRWGCNGAGISRLAWAGRGRRLAMRAKRPKWGRPRAAAAAGLRPRGAGPV